MKTPDTECGHHQAMREGGAVGLDQDGKCCDCGEDILEKTELVPQNKPDTELEGIVEEFIWQMKGDQHNICDQYVPAFCDKQEKRLRSLLSSRDTYWKERVDFEAIKWGYMKLLGFGLQNTTAENALMMDRLRDFYQE